MNTAAVLLENIIQGIQTVLWMALISLSFIDFPPQLLAFVTSNSTLVIALTIALCYWLGIMVDTTYYHLFIQKVEEKWVAKRITEGMKKEGITLSVMVFTCLAKSDTLARLLLERQAHLRMLRVSMVNIALICIAALLFMGIRGVSLSVAHYIWVLVVCGLLFYGTAYAWRRLYNYYFSIAKSGYTAITRPPSS